MARLIFIDGDWGGWSYNPGTNSWTHLFRTNGNDGSGLPQYPMSGYTNFAVYSKLGFIVFGGGNNVYKMNAAGTIATITTPPFAVNVGTGSTCCSVAADPVTGKIIVINASRQVWELNPGGSGTWTNTGIVAPARFSENVGVGESLISAPISEYGVVMYVKCNDSNACYVYLYKHTPLTSGGGTPADTQAPTTPANPATFVVSSSQINLSWTASTDNVGVTGYRVERCQGLGCSNFSQVATPSGTTFNNTGLSASTSYSYRMRATDAAGNLSGYSTVVSATTQVSATTPPPDTQSPTAPTSPMAAVVSSSQITLSWTASTDNVAVTGYRVERCQGSGCSNFGQITTSPGTTFSDAGLSASTTYGYRVRATDAAGNLSGYSTVVSATTQAGVPSGTGGGGATTDLDFAQRCGGAGVIKCATFDSSSEIAGVWGNVFGILPGTNANPQIDATVKASGAGSLKFTIPSQSGSNGAGSYFTNFSNNLSALFGENSTFYIQWRQRFDTNYVNHNFAGSGGKKLVIIGAGDQAGVCNPSFPTSATCPTSCTDIELVPTAQDIDRNSIVTAYNSCVTFKGFEYWDNALSQVTVQNAVGCLYPSYPVPPCIRLWPNEWMHFKVEVRIGNWNTANSTFRMWIGREGQASVKVLDFSPATGSPANLYNNTGNRYGKVWLLPYMTGKDPSETHPTAYTWYDELIISTTDIADPGGSGSGPSQPPVAPSGLTLR
jgi:chitodextrinase